MSTSGTSVFSNTARDIAHDALRENAIISIGDTMEAEELSAVLKRLNAMLKSWQMQGALWKQETITADGTADTATITLPSYVREVNSAMFAGTMDRRLYRWEREDYLCIPNKATKGTPSAFYLERNTGAAILHVWPVPTTSFTLSLDIDRAMDTVTDANQTLDIPEELTETVYANLALRCCGLFGIQPNPELVARSQMLERQMLDSWRPSFYTMGYGC